ncbi:MAG: immunoglobulin-like domain-containing protein [Eubacteriales bacterium]
MKILRYSILILFLLTLGIFTVFHLRQKNEDRTYPVITIDGYMLDVTIQATEEELMAGVRAYDEKDGDITDKVIIESISRFTEPGVSIVKYAVCDNDNHVSAASRKITYTDYTRPRFTLSDSLVFGVSQNINIRRLLGAVDSIDGDISNKVIITASEYSSNTPGVYYISAKVTNSKGDMISLQLPVYVEEQSLSAPKIVLEDYLIYRKVNEKYDISKNILSAVDNDQNDLTDQVQVDTNLDLTKPGIYEVHYRVSDASGRKGHSILTVIVEEE